MKARMDHPVVLLPGAMEGLHALAKAAASAGVPPTTIDLVHLRASQINGCSVCVQMHARDLRKRGEGDDRLFAVAAWRDTPYFSDAERAALALTEAVTRLSDSTDPVPDDVWSDATDHYTEAQLAGLLVAMAAINAWNRLNAATRQVAGSVGG
jgi:AhpD family alkylhydroperoxidase